MTLTLSVLTFAVSATASANPASQPKLTPMGINVVLDLPTPPPPPHRHHPAPPPPPPED